MKRRPKITSFAKLVIAVLIFLGLRYAYLNREEILSSDIFNFVDSTETLEEDSDTIQITKEENLDSINISHIDTLQIYTDTLEIIISRNDSIVAVKTNGISVNIPLKDTLLTGDTIPLNSLNNKNIFGRVIIQ
jgi:hypothetical protein